MMKLGKYEFDLLYNANAYFDIKEKLGEDFFALLFSNTREGFDALCDVLAELALQAELYRRYTGETEREVPTKMFFKLSVRLPEIMNYIEAVRNAIEDGMKRENEPEEIDEALLELEKKTAALNATNT